MDTVISTRLGRVETLLGQKVKDIKDMKAQTDLLTANVADLVVDALNYGMATGNSSVANTAALKNCINQNVGKVIFIPSGLYWVDGNIELPADTTIVGVPNETILKLSVVTDSNGVLFFKTANYNWDNTIAPQTRNIILRNLVIDGNKDAQIVYVDATTGLINVDNLLVDNITFQNMWKLPLSIKGCTNVIVQNCRTTNIAEGGFGVTYCTDVLIKDNMFKDIGEPRSTAKFGLNQGVAILMDNSDRVVIDKNRFFNCMDSNIYFDTGSSFCTASNNVIVNPGKDGIKFKVDRAGSYGAISSGDPWGYGNKCVNNTIINPGIVKDDGGNGIISHYQYDIVIAGNVIIGGYNTTTRTLTRRSTDSADAANYWGCLRDGISCVASVHASITGNIIKAMTTGIQFFLSNDVAALNNNIELCNKNGILVNLSQRVNIVGGNVRNNGQQPGLGSPAFFGLYISDSTIDSSWVTEAGGASQSKGNLAQGAYFVDTQTTKTQKYGIYNQSGINNQFANCTFSGNSTGTVYKQASDVEVNSNALS